MSNFPSYVFSLAINNYAKVMPSSNAMKAL